MAEVWERWGGVLAASAVAIPLVASMVWGLAAYRQRRGASASWARRASAAEVCAVAGTLPWIWMILTPNDGDRAVQLTPFVDLAELFNGDVSTMVVQLVGNLLVFAAAGFFLPVRFELGLGAVAAMAAAGSLVVEALQYVVDIGRVSSVDDVLLNTVGAVTAALLSRPWWRRRTRLQRPPRERPRARR